MNTIFRGMIDKYGHRQQTVVAIEEMAELTKALTKALRGEDDHECIVEEFTDVMIMMAQIKQMYNITEREYKAMADIKLTRMQNMLHKE